MTSKRNLKRKQCSRKIPFVSLSCAVNVARKSNRKQSAWQYRITPYRCSFCGNFHIGHSSN